jgi:hypothetical protein
MNQIDDITVIHRFVQGEVALLANANLRVEPAFNTAQLLAKRGGLIATAKLVGHIRAVLLRYSSIYGELVNQVLVDNEYIPVGTTPQGLTQYEYRPVPAGYAANYTEVRQLWKTWRVRYGRQQTAHPLLLKVLSETGWESVQTITFSQDNFFVRVASDEIMLHINDRLVWLSPNELPEQPI